MARTVYCIKLGREAEGLDLPPLPGELGKKIYLNVSKEAWEQWKRIQTMLVNENRLSMADPAARKWLLSQIEAYFFGEGVERPEGYVEPEAKKEDEKKEPEKKEPEKQETPKPETDTEKKEEAKQPETKQPEAEKEKKD